MAILMNPLCILCHKINTAQLYSRALVGTYNILPSSSFESTNTIISFSLSSSLHHIISAIMMGVLRRDMVSVSTGTLGLVCVFSVLISELYD